MSKIKASELIEMIGYWGGGPMATEVAGLPLANRAGHFFLNMRRWHWLESAPAGVAIVSAQDYVDMPADCDEIIAIDTTRSLISSITIVTDKELLRMRTSVFQISQWNFFAVPKRHYANTDGTSILRLHMWPEPSFSEADGVTVMYRRKWVDLSAIDDDIQIDDAVLELYYQILRAFVLGYSEDDVLTVDDRLQKVYTGALYAAATEWDSSFEPDLGVQIGGHVQGLLGPFAPIIRTEIANPA